MTRREAIEAELQKCRDRHGRITPKAVVARAKSSRNILHKLFIWSDRKAAQKQREDRARELITIYLTVSVIHRKTKFSVPYYIRDPQLDPEVAGYISTASLDRDNAVKALDAELDRCAGCVERARGLAAHLDQKHPGLAAHLDRMLDALVCTRDELRKAA